jgi:hypothetical protein
MNPRSIGKGAAVAALALTLFACGEGSKYKDEPRELGPVPVPESQPRDEPVKDDPYAKDEPSKDDPYSKGTASDGTGTTVPDPMTKTPAEPAPDALPKTPSTGDPPLPPADDTNAATAHREFQDAINARLKKVDERITELSTKVKEAAEDQRAALQKSFDDLSRQRDEAATKLDEIRAIAADKWNTASAELEKAVSDLEDAIERALK